MTAQLLRFRLEAGQAVDTWEIGAQTFCLATDTDEEGRANLRYPRWQNRAGRSLTRQDVVDGRVNAISYPNELDDEAFWSSLYYGSPDRLLKSWMMVGGIEHAKLMKSIRLMGEHVLPAVHEASPAPGLADELLGRQTAPDLQRAQAATPSD
jgi:hypothetical protein